MNRSGRPTRVERGRGRRRASYLFFVFMRAARRRFFTLCLFIILRRRFIVDLRANGGGVLFAGRESGGARGAGAVHEEARETGQ